jgi:hypothetical protein
MEKSRSNNLQGFITWLRTISSKPRGGSFEVRNCYPLAQSQAVKGGEKAMILRQNDSRERLHRLLDREQMSNH